MAEENKKENNLLEDYIAPTIGAAAGAVIGTVIAGPLGAMLGSVAGTSLEKIFVDLGEEVKERVLSKNESRRISIVLNETQEKIGTNLEKGYSIRQDEFYSDDIDGRNSMSEIIEGMLLLAQKENEERKLPYIANFVANINFDEMVSRSMANYFLKLMSQITYRQIVILSIIGNANADGSDIELRKIQYMGMKDYNAASIAAEIHELHRMSLISSQTAILDSVNFTPSHLMLSQIGQLLYKYMELENIETDKITSDILEFLTDNNTYENGWNPITARLQISEEIDEILEKKKLTPEAIGRMLDDKTANIIHIEDNEAGGQTLYLNPKGDNTKEFVDSKWIEDKLKEI